MRILAIRGENLASLAGKFEVEFDDGPLGGAGLFAIVGPTGSGKSTLLDALCLALYDKTPRLSGQGGHTLGRFEVDAAIKSNDVRNIVRHGCGQAWAEVDFAADDGREYTARWQVARARRKARGRIQKQSLDLRCKGSGEVISSGKKTEVLEEIKARVGLEFDQFRRSVLLAQGDFAAFLNADKNQRAELLERMTGTEIYAAVSRQAHLKLSEEKKKLELLETQLGFVAVLGDEELAELEGRRAELLAQRAALQGELKELVKVVEGFEARAKLEESKAENETVHAALTKELDRDASKLREVEELFTQAATRALRARRDREEAEEALKEARRLDDLLKQHRESKIEWQKKLEAIRGDRARLGEEIQSNEERLKSVDTRRKELERWRDEHPELVALEKEADKLGDLAVDCGKELERRGLARIEAQRAEEELGRLEQELRGKRVEEEKAGHELETQERRAFEARKQAEEIDRDELRASRSEATQGEQRLSRLLEARGKLEELAARRKEKERAAWEEEEKGKRAEVERDRLAKDIPLIRAAKDEAVRAWEDARSFRDLETQREKLEPGRPCPLCGASEHPWATRSSLDVHVDGREARVKALDEELSTAQQARARMEEQAHRAVQEQQKSKEELKALDTTIAQNEQLFDALWQPLSQPLPEDGVRAHLERSRQDILGRIAKLEELEQALSLREKSYRDLIEAAAAARGRREGVRAKREELERRTEAVRSAKAVAANTLARLEQDLDAKRGNLKAALARYDGSIYSDDFAETAARIEKIAANARRVSEGIALAEKEKASIEPDLAAARERASLLLANEDEAARELEALKHRAEISKKARGGIFEGRAADAVEEELRQRVIVAENAEKEQRASREGLRERIADKKGRRLTISEQTQKLAGEIGRLAAELQTGCHKLEVTCDVDAARGVQEKKASLLEENREQAAHIDARLKSDGDARKKIGALAQQIEEHRTSMRVWEVLGELIASADGAKFRKYAQSLTLDTLVAHANVHLRDLSRRYVVERVPGDELELQVVDTEMGDEVRAASSLSGGETFLVSLALALGLASMASSRVAVESLFVDEGFGTLDARTLDIALSALESLRASGRQVGVISHVPGLAEQLGARVEVTKTGPGRSRVRVLGAAASV